MELVFIYDSNWLYTSTFNMPNIYYGIVANNFYYFTPSSGYGIVKTSLTSSTVVKNYGTPGYRALYYDSTTSRINACGCESMVVHFFELDLT
jgi:hypothetical protein